MIPRGYLFVFSCASSFGLITSLAKLTYDEGASPPTVVFFRLLSGSLLMGVLSAWTHRKKLHPAKIKPKVSNTWTVAVLVGVTGISISVMSLGYLGSVKYIPVSLSVLPFFHLPILGFVDKLSNLQGSPFPLKTHVFRTCIFWAFSDLGSNLGGAGLERHCPGYGRFFRCIRNANRRRKNCPVNFPE